MQTERIRGLDSDVDNHGPGKREVDLYVRTYTTLLQSSGAISVASLEPAHITAASSLHAGALEPEPDLNAFIYSVQRLPASIADVRMIVLGQQQKAFVRAGYANMSDWQVQSAPGRRRRWLFDGTETLAAYIASSSDLDDLIPTIVAFQIEWNKMHRIIRDDDRLGDLLETAGEDGIILTIDEIAEVGERLLLSTVDWQRLQSVWGLSLWRNLSLIASGKKRYELMMVGGSFVGYTRSTRQWWSPVERLLMEMKLDQRPIYFVSSNMHSFANVLTGTARRRERELKQFARESTMLGLADELEKIESGKLESSLDNLLYFAARPYFALPAQLKDRERRTAEETERGVYHIDPRSAVDVGVQVIDLSKTDLSSIDPRLCHHGTETLDPRATDAIIVNVNYPLGFAAYHITVSGRDGDRADPRHLRPRQGRHAQRPDRRRHDRQCRLRRALRQHLLVRELLLVCQDCRPVSSLFGAALDNQKAVTVKGTYLQNQGYLDFYYRENYTVVEMEAGPYLSAIYEDCCLERHPSEQAINLRGTVGHDIDLGIIHYASDTPYTRAQTLGARGMSFYGMDSTYASTIAILRRIFQKTGTLKSREVE